jgi:hypothetical protein
MNLGIEFMKWKQENTEKKIHNNREEEGKGE